MLVKKVDSKRQTIGYHFVNSLSNLPVQMHSIGWELQTSPSYYFDGTKRSNEIGNCIFQYTLSGFGMLEKDGQYYHLNPGDAFLLSVPQNHRYYLPESSSSWEFLFFTLKGIYTKEIWDSIISLKGPVLSFEPDNPFTAYLWSFYKQECSKKDSSVYETSAAAYQFLMQLQYHINTLPIEIHETYSIPDVIDQAVHFMNDNLSENIGLEEIAASIHMTKYHFTRLFKKEAGISPWTYFTKLRVENAARLLLTTELTINEIAPQCGFDNSNYFNKVFRKFVGLSAGQFRTNYSGMTHFTLNL